MNKNISVSFVTPEQVEQEKPPAQSVSVQGSCLFKAGGENAIPYAICANPRFQLFVGEYLAKTNQSPYSLKVDENAYLFIQDNDANLLWIEFCQWFVGKQEQGRWVNDTPPNPKKLFEFGTSPNQAPIRAYPQPAPQVAPQPETEPLIEDKAEIDKVSVLNKLLDLIEENIKLGREILHYLRV